MSDNYIIGQLDHQGEPVPLVATVLRAKDILGAMRVRWGISRDSYRVSPGLYGVGNPGAGSDVFVTSNYKLTFDHLRKNLADQNAWILVLDTRGVNVWCAAGKGTFGTDELVRKIKSVSLENVVTHRKLILPQLGATGVSAHKVKEQTGFSVHYGPVLAADIPSYISNGYRATSEMRRVKFTFSDRLRLIPNDFVYGKYYLLGALVVMFLASGLSRNGLSFTDFRSDGAPALLTVFLAYVAGIVITPALLPWIPGRHFSLKGFFAGLLAFAAFLVYGAAGMNMVGKISWFLVISAISSFTAMNFTGSSTYTSLSGVKKEMKIFLPLQIGFAAAGLIMQIISKLIVYSK